MNVGQLWELKLFDRPPSKKVGNELAVVVAVEEVLVAVDDVVIFELLSVVVVVFLDVVELVRVVDGAVDIVISNVVVTESSDDVVDFSVALFLRSWS